MANKQTRLPIGEIGLVKETPSGRIQQIGIVAEHQKMLQLFLGQLSQIHPLIEMGADYDLKLVGKRPSTIRVSNAEINAIENAGTMLQVLDSESELSDTDLKHHHKLGQIMIDNPKEVARFLKSLNK